MHGLKRDIVQAIVMGMVVPYVMLSFAVRLWEREWGAVPVFEAAEQTQEGFPVSVLTEQGTQEIGLEEYLAGVLLAEMPADFQMETLKAQAVAARTFTVKAVQTGGKHAQGVLCTDSTCCQGYLSPKAYLLRGGGTQQLERVREAVSQTAGQVLTYGQELIEATYFACSGGRTEEAVEVWGADYPYLISVDSPGEEQAAHYRDTAQFTSEEFQRAIGQKLSGTPGSWFSHMETTVGGGVKSVQIGSRTYSGTELRKLLGLRSTAFTIWTSDAFVQIETRGYGHRVGMSQYGAEAMAANGADYAQILAHYYPGTALEIWKNG